MIPNLTDEKYYESYTTKRAKSNNSIDVSFQAFSWSGQRRTDFTIRDYSRLSIHHPQSFPDCSLSPSLKMPTGHFLNARSGSSPGWGAKTEREWERERALSFCLWRRREYSLSHSHFTFGWLQLFYYPPKLQQRRTFFKNEFFWKDATKDLPFCLTISRLIISS